MPTKPKRKRQGMYLSSRTIIASAADVFLFNPAISAYSAVRYVPDSRLRSTVSRLISDYQPPDQHLSKTLLHGCRRREGFVWRAVEGCWQASTAKHGVPGARGDVSTLYWFLETVPS